MIALIPAAGKASRFDGLYKELLPIDETEHGRIITGLSHSLMLAWGLGCDKVIIITNKDKVSTHRSYITQLSSLNYMIPEYVVLQNQLYTNDLWGAIKTFNSCWNEATTMNHTIGKDDHCIMIMPDTVPYFEHWPLDKVDRCDFTLGLFETETPERYSTYNSYTNQIITKQACSGTCDAWGMVGWSKRVADFWLRTEETTPYRHYDEAFNDVLWRQSEFTRNTFEISSYHDIGTFERYKEFLRSKG